MQVRCNEGVAIRIDPESCVCIREDADEALTGERIGQLEPRKTRISGGRRGHRHGRQHGERGIASAFPLRRGRRPWHVWKLFAREPGGLGFDRRLDAAGPHREGEEP